MVGGFMSAQAGASAARASNTRIIVNGLSIFLDIHWLSEDGGFSQWKIEVPMAHTAIYDVCDAV